MPRCRHVSVTLYLPVGLTLGSIEVIISILGFVRFLSALNKLLRHYRGVHSDAIDILALGKKFFLYQRLQCGNN